MAGNGSKTAAAGQTAKLLSEISKNGLEPQDPEVKEKYNEFRLDVTKQALRILRERIPKKIIYFNDQVNATKHPEGYLRGEDLEQFEVPRELSGDAEGEVARQSKRQRGENGAPTKPENKPCEAAPDVKSHQYAPSHAQIVKMEAHLKREALELIEMAGIVKLWIQLNVPRIEDGNNFGVAIQEEAINELGRVEDAAFSLCDGIKYHMGRAKILTKVIKYPNIEDYQKCVHEVDQKEWLHLKVAMIDMRNSYSMLYELLHKNWEKVVKPKNTDGHSMMVM